MRPAKEYHETRMMLRELLKDPMDGKVQVPPSWTEHEKFFITVTAAHLVMLYRIAFEVGFDAEAAVKGVDALHASARKLIFEICDEEDPKR